MKDKMNFKEYKEWLKNSLLSYYACRAKHIHKIVDYNKVIIMNARTGKTASVFCNKEDVFDDFIGTAIAWAKYNNRKIPEFIDERIPISDLKIGQKFKLLESEITKLFTDNTYEFLGVKKGHYAVRLHHNKKDSVELFLRYGVEYKVFPID